MSEPKGNHAVSGHEPGPCLVRSVADTMAEEPALEAVTIDRAQHKISVATLGRADVSRLTERIKSRFQAAQSADTGHVCSLFNGVGDCFDCDTPMPEPYRRRIRIKHDGDITTIARQTCPTAPAFWRYRLQGPWRKAYAIGAVVALYLNVFVLVVQLFRHVPLLNQFAPTQTTEPAFQVAELVVLIAFVAIGVLVVRGVKRVAGYPAHAAAAI